MRLEGGESLEMEGCVIYVIISAHHTRVRTHTYVRARAISSLRIILRKARPARNKTRDDARFLSRRGIGVIQLKNRTVERIIRRSDRIQR